MAERFTRNGRELSWLQGRWWILKGCFGMYGDLRDEGWPRRRAFIVAFGFTRWPK